MFGSPSHRHTLARRGRSAGSGWDSSRANALKDTGSQVCITFVTTKPLYGMSRPWGCAKQHGLAVVLQTSSGKYRRARTCQVATAADTSTSCIEAEVRRAGPLQMDEKIEIGPSDETNAPERKGRTIGVPTRRMRERESLAC
jgi:hypothetical protein